jgi:hypothetical protein
MDWINQVGMLTVETNGSKVEMIGFRANGQMVEHKFRNPTTLDSGRYAISIDKEGYAVATLIPEHPHPEC